MNNIETLTQKIYQEGVEKANQEADEILHKAKDDATQIVANAKKEAADIKKSAEDEAVQLKRNTEAEIKLSAQQAVSQLKQNIKELLSDKILGQSTGKIFADADFLKQIILETIKNWKQDQGVELHLSEDLQKKLGDSFENSIRKEVKNLEIKPNPRLEKGFRISQEGNAYQITFTEKDFEAFFSPLLKERAQKIVFEKD
jgi:V/A-type H+-transporting ATPase subunit E